MARVHVNDNGPPPFFSHNTLDGPGFVRLNRHLTAVLTGVEGIEEKVRKKSKQAGIKKIDFPFYTFTTR